MAEVEAEIDVMEQLFEEEYEMEDDDDDEDGDGNGEHQKKLESRINKITKRID